MFLKLLDGIFAWVIIFPAVFFCGRSFKRFFSIREKILCGIVLFALGMVCLSYGVVVLDFLGLLNRWVIWACLFSIVILRFQLFAELLDWLRAVWRSFEGPEHRSTTLLNVLFIVSFIFLLTGVASPETGGDALCYHLNLPKIFLKRGSLSPLYYDINSYFPLFFYNLYLIGLATGGVLTAKLFHFVCGLLLFFGVREVVHQTTKKASMAIFSALIVWLTPGIFNMLSTTYVDVALAFFIFVSLLMLINAFEQESSGAYLLSGLLAGCAISIKYLGLLGIIALGGVWLFKLVGKKTNFNHIGKFSLWVFGIIMGSGYWLLLSWYRTKNPFYPFYGELFGTDPIPGLEYEKYGMGRSFMDFIQVYWNLFAHPEKFGGMSDQIGILYFLCLPFFIYGALRWKATRPYAVFALVFLVFWFVVCQASRYLFPVLPSFVIVSAAGLPTALRKLNPRLKDLVKTGGVLLLSSYLLVGIYHYRYSVRLFLGFWTPKQYLLNLERTATIASWVNQHLSQASKILLEREIRQFYFNRPVIRDVALRYRTHYDQDQADVGSVHNFMKSEGITHILLSDLATERSGDREQTILRKFVSSRYAELIHTATSQNIREGQHIYKLYEVKP